MRHTLLPLNERKMLRRDYYARLIIVLCFLISLSGLVGIAALFPAYIHAKNSEQEQNSTVTKQNTSKEAQLKATIESELRADDAVVKKIQDDFGTYKASQAIELLVSARGPTSISAISFNQDSKTAGTLTFTGKASTRADLLALKDRLESTFVGSKVDLPIDELAKNKDIDFALKITYKLP